MSEPFVPTWRCRALCREVDPEAELNHASS